MAPLRTVHFRHLERLLWTFLVGIAVSTVWIGSFVAVPEDLSVRLMSKNATSAVYNKNMWKHSVAIPDWMKEYMDYHTEVVQNLTPQNWVDHKYLVLRCYRTDERCGGLSDRLKPVPLILLAAQRSQRIFFIDWDRPVELQNFLVPPRNGFQWSPPRFLVSIFRSSASNDLVTRASNIISRAQTSTAVQVHTHLQDFRGGETQFDEQLGQGSFQSVYHDVFRIFFEPSPDIQTLIDRHLIRESSSKVVFSREALIEGQYSVAHYRAEYGKEIQRHPILSDPDFLTKIAINAVRCASELQTSNVPIYFASDNPLALETVRQLAQAVDYPIVTFHREEDIPKHLDNYDNNTHPSDYYSTFVDLYLAGSGRCVTYGRGGFGRYASLLSFNATCSSKHVKQFFPNTCYGRPPFQID